MIEVVLQDTRWQAVALEDLASEASDAVLARLGLDPATCDIVLLACDDARISSLNAQFREKSAPTNVLSWPAQELSPPALPVADPDGTIPLGDLALAYDTCQREAADQGKSMAEHVTHLVVHGVLHLLGYDHVRDEDATLMEAIEVEILGKLGVDDPYS